jgi:hypothetical protein
MKASLLHVRRMVSKGRVVLGATMSKMGAKVGGKEGDRDGDRWEKRKRGCKDKLEYQIQNIKYYITFDNEIIMILTCPCT